MYHQAYIKVSSFYYLKICLRASNIENQVNFLDEADYAGE